MTIQAKVTSIDQSISSAAAVEIPENGIIHLSQSSNVALDVAPDAVAGYSKSGSDLIVQLKTGETVRIADFYAEGQPSSQLFLADKDQLVAVDLPPVAADGPLMAGYIPQESFAGFESLTGAGLLGGMSAGTALLIGAAVIGGGVALSNSGGGGGGGGGVPPDTTPPKAASGLKVAPDGSGISGQAEAGASVGIDTSGDGKPDITVIADSNGNFTAPLNPPLTDGQTVTVVVTDPAGNASPPAQVVAPDTTAPAPATGVQVAPDGGSVIGKAEPGATVGVDSNGDGQPDTTVVVGPDGSFEVPLNPPLTNGETVTVVVTDPSGNVSPPTQATAPDTTAPAPATGVQVAPDGGSVIGKAEPGATVGVDSNGDGQPDTTVVVGPDGSFEVPLNPPLTNGETVTVVVTDPAGNSSTPVTAEAPDFPDAPQVNASNGSTLSGTAEAGVTLVITDGNGNPIGQATADANGNWTFTPASQLPDGTVVNVVARDAAGNSSPATSITVDGVAPSAPVVEPSNGSELSGTAEPGSSVTLTDGNGNTIGQVTADANGNWTLTPSTPLPDGTVVNVVARDAAGNSSPPASVTVDAVAPATPIVDPSNGTTLSGTAEPDSSVTLTDGNGNPIGQVTADGSGNWTFTPTTPLPNGTVVNATATDPSGNASAPASVTVDAVAPATPVVNPSNGTTLSGTAEPGSSVTLTDGNGAPIGQVTADGSGNWSFTPSTALPNGTVVTATATDPSGNTSPGASTTVDSQAPAAPLVDPSNGTTISGSAEPGSTVTLTDGNGDPIGQVTADGSGNWSFTPITPMADGSVINASATDAAGNTSGQASVTVDGVAPATPTVNLSNGSNLTGTAEPGSTVTLTDGNGNPIAEVTADGSGNWTYTPSTPIANGTVVNVVAQDAAGNNSPGASVTVDSQAPAAPVINPSNGITISGSAEPGSTVTLTDGNGNSIAQVTADGSGSWTFTPSTPLANGTVVNATATDPTGNTSAPASTTVDSVAPAAPVVNPSNGAEISGTAEPGASVTLTDGSGNPIGQATADGSGNWSFTPTTPLADGTVVNATATDAAGNTSGQASVTVDGVAPATPTVNLSNGSSLTGSAEPNSTVTLTDGNGNPIAEVTADGSGNWTYTPSTPIANGTVVNVVARDAAGNSSPPATVTVDSSAPPAPVINPSNGTTISGTAEAGASVTLTDGNGNPIGQVTADGSGNWSYSPATPLANGTVIVATATDPTGNTGPQAATTVDSVAPPAPLVNPSNGATISGTAEAGAKVILTDGNGNPIGETTADGNGNWSFTPGTPLANGTVVNAVAQDPAGNTGPQGSTTVDSVAPPSPVVNPSNGNVINGTAEPGSTITLTDGNGNPIGQVSADGSGNWTFSPASQLPNGTVVNATATDAAGNTSGPGSTTVDTSLPSIPQVDPSNGSVISGTADAGNTIIITDGSGNPIGQVSADGSGNWSFTPGIPLPDGTVVNVVARSPSNVDSAPAVITVDGVAPAAPVVEPSNGTEISGTAEAGATIILTDGNGNPIGQTTADGSGNWSFTPSTPLPNGTVVNATATDPAGNTSGPASVTVDAVAPPVPVINPSNGVVISGTAEAGAKVFLTDGSGNPIGEVTADGSGNWTYTPSTPLADGTLVNAVAQDPSGNTSGPASATVDAVAPAAPVVNPSNGTVISGTAEAGATIILTDGNGNPIGQTTADGSGNWSFTPATPLANGTLINAVAEDAAGNASGPASATVDAVAPAVPVIDPSNGSVISGTAEAGATVILTDGGGNPIGQATADGSGNWSFTPATPLADGAVINAVAQDPAGNTSGPASTTVDAVAPAIPVLNPSNGSVIAGTAEAGAKVILTDGNGNPIGETTADGSGNWSFTPATPLANGTVVNAVAQDTAGNTSGPASTTVDTVAPATPVLDASNGTVISGTAEAGATVILTDGNGNPIGQATADGSGNWSFTPGTPLTNGTVVNAVAQDAAGNTSGPVSTTVDAVAPATPVIAPSNGVELSGTAEPGVRVILTDSNGNPVGQTLADGSGNWTFTPSTPLANGTVVNAVAQDPAGNTSGPASTTVDTVAPATPVINASNGSVITGTAEVGAKVILTDGNGNPIGETTADGSGNWTFTPGTPLANGTVINAVAEDAAGNASGPVSTTVDSVAPSAPLLSISADGALLTGTAEPNSQVRIVVNGDTANPITVNVDGSGNFSLPFAPPLVTGELIAGVAVDAVGNVSGPATINAPDLAPPTISVPEAADSWINAAEIGDGIQVDVAVRPTMQAGQVITVKFAGQNGYEAEVSHTLTAGDIAIGNVTLTLLPPSGQGPFPEGASTVTADINGGTASNTVSFTVDTVPPPAPVLSLVGNILTISTEPGTEVTVEVNIGGAVATVTLTADNTGLASLDLLTGLDIDLSWDQLLNAQVSVKGEDLAGNPSPVASIGVGTNIPQPVTIGNFGLDVGLLPPTFGFSGDTAPNSGLEVRVVTPAANVTVPLTADASGHFALNLLDPALLLQLGLGSITDLLNLGSQLSFNVVAIDSNGNDSASYGITLSGSGVGLNIGQIDVNGTSGDDVLSGANGSSEHINGGAGSDLILNVGTGDQVQAGDGNDTIQITATDFVSIDGGNGFDTLLLANGIDLDYNAVGVGTLSNLERIDLGKGDGGSVLTLTAAEVDVITDASNTLQITGESNDTLNVSGAVNTGTTQLINGITYDVYTFGSTTLLIEDNTVQVVV
ncbi:Ig-like domain-containing protein [Pseudomonas paraeruginosa]|uniref:BapA prefix-like domain-containing protein n=10 Tax=Pseudomonas aeruginosa group TaxID=136841 RepID=A0ABD7JZH6_PSEAI|nr:MULTISPECIES: Ig-like domain-containing protein [Pseudomonas aeruginosa group]RTR94809.1 BapA prefix-like domain-containing protein [Pseudomonas paraeruginosa]RTS43069.1 BapA prefix-like domain-containing protein [Pseudomonas aeruginosa]